MVKLLNPQKGVVSTKQRASSQNSEGGPQAMKITQIDIMTPHIQENPMWRPILCRIHTDEGIYGDGEAALAYGIASRPRRV